MQRCRGHRVTYSHPEMREYLLRFGYAEADLTYVANGMDIAVADATPDQPLEHFRVERRSRRQQGKAGEKESQSSHLSRCYHRTYG